MGHMLKNTKFKSGSYALGVPVGTSSIGPDNAVYGQTRFNTSTNKLEFYANVGYGNVWNAVSAQGNVRVTKDSFTGNAVAVQFWPMTSSYSSGQEAQVLVHVGTVYQIPVTNYTFNGTGNIIFNAPPSNGAAITVIHGYASTVSSLA